MDLFSIVFGGIIGGVFAAIVVMVMSFKDYDYIWNAAYKFGYEQGSEMERFTQELKQKAEEKSMEDDGK